MNPGKLKAEVDSWVGAGIITAAQAASIMARYDTHVPAYKKMSFWLQCLASVLVGLALFLVISANWQRMNWLTQSLITALPLFVAQIWAFWQEGKGNALAAEVGWFFASIALGANIMMQAQIFHISAYYPNGILFWVVGILPVIWLRASAVNYLLASVLFVIYLVMQMDHHQFSLVSILPLAVFAIYTWSRQRVYSIVPLFGVIYFLLQTVLLKWQIDVGGLMWDFSLILFAVALLQQLAELKETSLRRILILLFAFTALFNLLLTFKHYARHVHIYAPSVLSLVLVGISFIAL